MFKIQNLSFNLSPSLSITIVPSLYFVYIPALFLAVAHISLCWSVNLRSHCYTVYVAVAVRLSHTHSLFFLSLTHTLSSFSLSHTISLLSLSHTHSYVLSLSLILSILSSCRPYLDQQPFEKVLHTLTCNSDVGGGGTPPDRYPPLLGHPPTPGNTSGADLVGSL